MMIATAAVKPSQKFKVKPRQSGKTTKLIKKFVEYPSESVYLSVSSDSVKRVCKHVPPNRFQDVKNINQGNIDTLLFNVDKVFIDDFIQMPSSRLNAVLAHCKYHDISVLGYSSL